MKKNLLLFSLTFSLIALSTEIKENLTNTFKELEQIKSAIESVAPTLKEFDALLDKNKFSSLSKEKQAPYREAELVRGVGISKVEKITSGLNLKDPKSPHLGDVTTIEKLANYFVFFQKFSDGLGICDNLRPALEQYVKNQKGAKVDQSILDCINFEKEEGGHLVPGEKDPSKPQGS